MQEVDGGGKAVEGYVEMVGMGQFEVEEELKALVSDALVKQATPVARIDALTMLGHGPSKPLFPSKFNAVGKIFDGCS